jgi:hypothetical protein
MFEHRVFVRFPELVALLTSQGISLVHTDLMLHRRKKIGFLRWSFPSRAL